MTTPERPSLADTLAHIDAVLADDEGDRCEISHVTRDNGGFSGSRCPNQALPGLYYCQAHTDRYGVSRKPGSRFLDTVELQVRGPVTMQDRLDIERVCNYHLPLVPQHVEPAPPDPDWVTFEPLSKPGWLARTLRRLFT